MCEFILRIQELAQDEIGWVLVLIMTVPFILEVLGGE